MAAHYLPNLRKIITRKRKEKPLRVKPTEPLDFHREKSKASSVPQPPERPNPQAPLGNRSRPQLISQRMAAAVPVPEELRHWAQGFSWRRAMCVFVPVAVILAVCGIALVVALYMRVEQPICDEDCMRYTKLLAETMDWSVDPCKDFYLFVCGRSTNETSVRRRLNDGFIATIIDIARRQEVPAEGQSVAQRAARLFKTCDDIVSQDTDYVPRLRGYMRDANLHWPEHPDNRDVASVDVFRSMLQINDKWGWPCLFDFITEHVGDAKFEVVVYPTRHLEHFQHHVFTLGPGSSAHRRYFETLYAHYGGGVVEGVTFEEMVDYEAEILTPLLELYHAPPRIYVLDRNYSHTSALWERWTSAIRRYHGLSGNERIEISTTHREYFELVVELIATREAVVELFIGWLAVQFTARFANRTCFAFTVALTGIALLVPFIERFYTEPVRDDTWRIARDVRRTVYQTLNRATYPWADVNAAFRYMELTRAPDIESRFARFPDMEASFVKNLRDAITASRRTDDDSIGVLDPRWLFYTEMYRPRILRDRYDYALKPSILLPPMYHVTAPLPVRLGTFGVEVARATVHTYEELRFEGHETDALDRFQVCYFQAEDSERQEEPGPEWVRRVQYDMLTGAALDVALSVLREEPSFDEDRLRGVPLTGHQLFYVAHCLTYCGGMGGHNACNEPLRHKGDFADAFSCSAKSNMRSEHQCKSF
ncbi:hypothetical protein HPB50_011346 [Hyalomma asiaticum]|uniref:Uncharacterized protein n=1 Tax=Hyalomma asiaticum TaxID=266040 RepID=A0ACB7TA36_HYAAI|nr:hypothetical protein HPB50_011346 [Hyalomma asiaticum]